MPPCSLAGLRTGLLCRNCKGKCPPMHTWMYSEFCFFHVTQFRFSALFCYSGLSFRCCRETNYSKLENRKTGMRPLHKYANCLTEMHSTKIIWDTHESTAISLPGWAQKEKQPSISFVTVEKVQTSISVHLLLSKQVLVMYFYFPFDMCYTQHSNSTLKCQHWGENNGYKIQGHPHPT